MRTTFLLILNLTSVMLYSQTKSNRDIQLLDDEKKIREVALHYIEGWYSADTIRMAKALSQDLVKRGFVRNNNTNEEMIAGASFSQMIKWTGGRENRLAKGDDIEIKIEIIEIGRRIANVKTTTPDFIDYIHLGKMDGQWKIYNVVWERVLSEK